MEEGDTMMSDVRWKKEDVEEDFAENLEVLNKYRIFAPSKETFGI